ncbi:MAG: hypothetical protein GX640_15000 [Fibrobacter sp.]|nr:hypothetical protein [Fibrobacter sp.]
MMDSNDTILIQDLTEMFNSQLFRYRELRDLVRKALGRLVLSRGDMAAVMAGLEKKKKILELIEQERIQYAGLISRYQERKAFFKDEPLVDTLNTVLDNTGTAIREFLDEEEQLKKYIEGILKMEDCKTRV